MDKSGNCTACPCKGHWTGHKNLPYHYIPRVITKEKKSNELYTTYKQARNNKKSQESLMNGLGQKFIDTQKQIQKDVVELRKSIAKLEVRETLKKAILISKLNIIFSGDCCPPKVPDRC